MPYTPQQEEALRALAWLYSDRTEDRRTGRTFILATAAVRRAIQTAPQWVRIQDHHPTRDADNVLLQAIEQVGSDLGLEIERDPSYVRFRIAGTISERALASLNEPRGSSPGGPKPPPASRRTQWEILSEEDDDDSV